MDNALNDLAEEAKDVVAKIPLIRNYYTLLLGRVRSRSHSRIHGESSHGRSR